MDLITFYRLAAAPVAAGMLLAGQRDAFYVLVIVSLVSDLIDGPIARWRGQQSERGARLDTIADAWTTLVGILGLYVFESATLRPELPWLYLFLATYAAAAFASLAKFRRLPAYHLYLSKAAAFLSGVFFIWLYAAGYSRPLFLAVLALGGLANFESLLATLRLRRFRSDIGSFFLIGALERDEK